MKLENKLEWASNFRAWKTRIDLILAKNKVLDIMKGKIMEPQVEARKEKEPHNVAVMEKHKDNDINDPGGYRWPPTFSSWLKTTF
jgi:hypothetical protein